MTSPIDICNMALSQIGARSTISSFSDGTKEAQQCTIWYDTLREQLIRSALWGFARKQATLSLLGDLVNQTSPWPWPYKYMYPGDCLRMRYVLPPTPPVNTGVVGVAAPTFWGLPQECNRFEIGYDTDSSNNARRVVLSNVNQAQAIYTVDVTDVSLFDAQFKNGLAALLAMHIVIPLTGNKEMRLQFAQYATASVDEARASDGNEAFKNSTDHTPDWISSRNSGYGYAPPFSYGNWWLGYETFGWYGVS